MIHLAFSLQIAFFILSPWRLSYSVFSNMIDIIDGVHRIEVPTPFPVGSVNSYLIEGSPLTLIDTGPKTSKSLTAIQQGLQALSYDLSDIEQILLTHSHVDHAGLISQFVRRRLQIQNIPPEVWVHEKDAEAVINYERYMERYTAAFVRLTMASGVLQSETTIPTPENRTEFFKKIGESVPTAHTFRDGATFKTGIGELTAVWTPGHSPGSTCFACDEKQIIFSGDHILGDISSNPSISFDDSERIGMITYFESLDCLESRAGYLALPGHRGPIRDIKSRIAGLRAEYVEKLQKAASSLTKDPRTVYEISRIVYGDYDTQSLVLALAESRDLLRILETRNQAKLLNREGVLYALRA